MNKFQEFIRRLTKPINFFDVPCPGCQKDITFENTHYITTNIYTNGRVEIDLDFYQPINKCDNPLCEWSIKHKDDIYDKECIY